MSKIGKAEDDLTRRHEDTKVGKTVKACSRFRHERSEVARRAEGAGGAPESTSKGRKAGRSEGRKVGKSKVGKSKVERRRTHKNIGRQMGTSNFERRTKNFEHSTLNILIFL
jgi:hypothetical protein